MSANLDILLMGVKIEKTSVFTSATRPLLLPFRWRSIKIDKDKDQDSTLMMMFKTGDDMRQDALILQLFSIMDKELRGVDLDMNFTIYNLISFTVDDGLLQFVPNSATVTKIKKEKFPNDRNCIEKYMREGAKTDENPKDYEDRILPNYIKSFAGYCTATYLLGIGDRHLENIMIDVNGLYFHIDFGFIFGKEPNDFKTYMASKIRIHSVMITALGGP